MGLGLLLDGSCSPDEEHCLLLQWICAVVNRIGSGEEE